MTRIHYFLLVVSCAVGVLSVAMSEFVAPQIVRVAPGLLIAFIVPGFALVSAVIPSRQFSPGEYLPASVGASVVLSTTAAVALAAAPVGLTRLSFSLVLGSCTLIFSILAAWRDRLKRSATKREGALRQHE